MNTGVSAWNFRRTERKTSGSSPMRKFPVYGFSHPRSPSAASAVRPSIFAMDGLNWIYRRMDYVDVMGHVIVSKVGIVGMVGDLPYLPYVPYLRHAPSPLARTSVATTLSRFYGADEFCGGCRGTRAGRKSRGRQKSSGGHRRDIAFVYRWRLAREPGSGGPWRGRRRSPQKGREFGGLRTATHPKQHN